MGRLGHPDQGAHANPVQDRDYRLRLRRLRLFHVRGAVLHHARRALLPRGGVVAHLWRADPRFHRAPADPRHHRLRLRRWSAASSSPNMPSRAAATDTLAGKLMLVSAIAFSIVFATILLAHIFERFGYAPCPLCLQERYAYYFGVPALVVAFFAARAEFMLTRILLALVALAFLINAGVGVYHSGIEWKWWRLRPAPAASPWNGRRRRGKRDRAGDGGELQRCVLAHGWPLLRRMECGDLCASCGARRLRRCLAAVT